MGVFDSIFSRGNNQTVISGISGKSIVVTNGKVYVDGVEAELPNQKSITIEVTGNVESIKVDMGDVNVTGNVTNGVKTGQGEIKVGGDVSGDVVSSQGNIKCGNVTGNVKTAMGNINKR